ncbi:M23 family metallopeptidase [Marinifilum sp. D714]|uniref:M23 family metallopeptidase n=1 Tax=Marinifilum sp. D714 TaxID=2937523 RepID=UPI0027D06625|nr:M23 family metallopeptidase [Marinifilum sp. D714]MDQ2180304.1 peptidoglycan DD-metalloendopeptidase family protein [Marinifilum sp. D714]
MRKFILISGLLLVIVSFFALEIKAQELDSFEAYKKAEKARFQKYKEEYKRQFEAFKKNELDWNKEILGIEVETPVSEKVEAKDKDLIAKPPVPSYVNLTASLDDEIKQIKRKVEKIAIEEVPAEPMKSAEVQTGPKQEAKVKAEEEQPQAMTNPTLAAKQSANSNQMTNPVANQTAAKAKVNHTPSQKMADPGVKGKGNEMANSKTSTPAPKAVAIDSHKASLIEVEKRSIPSTKPIYDKYRLSSKFGNRFHPTLYRWRFHGGVDMACPKGTDIHIPADGVIVKSGWNGGYGNYIKVKHGNGYETIYGHLSKVSVKKGQKVNKGDVIGKVGSTGRSTGPHLHYEIIKNKKRVNPERFFG